MLEIEQQKLSPNSYGHSFSLRCPIQAHSVSRCSKLNIKAQGKFKQPKLMTRMSDADQYYIETLEIEQRKISRKSNGKNLLGMPASMR